MSMCIGVAEVQQHDLIQESCCCAVAWPYTVELLECNSMTMCSRVIEVQQHYHV